MTRAPHGASITTKGAVAANRAIDVAAAGAGVSAEAVAAAVAKQVDASVTPVIASALAAAIPADRRRRSCRWW